MRYDWFKFYPARYRAKTIDFTPAQDGIYRRLIDYYMETGGPLPLKMTGLARAAGVSLAEMEDAWSVIRPLVEERDGGYHDNICDDELAKQEGLHRSLSANGKKAHPGHAMAEAPAQAPAQPAPKQNRTEQNREKESPPVAPPLTSEENPNAETVHAEPKPKSNRDPRKCKLLDWLKANGPADGAIPPDWLEWAEQKHGWDDATIAHVAEGFWRYFTGPDAKEPNKIDWKRAFQTWCDRDTDKANAFIRSRKGASGGQKQGYTDSVLDSSEKARRLLEAQADNAEDTIPEFE